MYIPEFWCGVAAVLLAEIVGLIVVGLYSSGNSKNGRK